MKKELSGPRVQGLDVTVQQDFLALPAGFLPSMRDTHLIVATRTIGTTLGFAYVEVPGMSPASSPLMLMTLTLLLAGVPEFPALSRAVERAFPVQSIPQAPPPAARVTPPPEPRSSAVVEPAAGRGALVPLYASFVALQALDVHSTMRALNGGAAEANPLLSGLAHRPAALIAVKAGLATTTILLADKVRLKSRAAAVALMAAVNSAYAMIVAHNYRVAR